MGGSHFCWYLRLKKLLLGTWTKNCFQTQQCIWIETRRCQVPRRPQRVQRWPKGAGKTPGTVAIRWNPLNMILITGIIRYPFFAVWEVIFLIFLMYTQLYGLAIPQNGDYFLRKHLKNGCRKFFNVLSIFHQKKPMSSHLADLVVGLGWCGKIHLPVALRTSHHWYFASPALGWMNNSPAPGKMTINQLFFYGWSGLKLDLSVTFQRWNSFFWHFLATVFHRDQSDPGDCCYKAEQLPATQGAKRLTRKASKNPGCSATNTCKNTYQSRSIKLSHKN